MLTFFVVLTPLVIWHCRQ